MGFLNSILGRVFSLLFLPWRSLNPWLAMIFISFLTGLFMLFIFRWTSNQAGIRQAKNTIKAHLLEIRLYKDSLPIALQAYGKILRSNLKYVALSAKPMLVMLLPLLLALTHLNLWFGYEPLRVGDATILKIFWDKNVIPLNTEVELETPDGLAVETLPLRLEEARETNWRIRAEKEGFYVLKIKPGGVASISTAVVVGTRSLAPICPRRSQRFLDNLFYPGQKPLPSFTSIQSVEIKYPARRMTFFGLKLHWLIPYFFLSLVFGFALKRPLGVEI